VDIVLKHSPDALQFDALILGCPVMAFSYAPAMKAWLDSVLSLDKKKVACFVTKMLPFKWTGGTGAVKSMVSTCINKGADIAGSEVIVLSAKNSRQQIEKMVADFSQHFS
jgi:NAD(P)H dehydrogenase (quinone)